MKTQEQIKKSVVDQLVWDNRVDASDIQVKVSDGEVILKGTVPTYSEKVTTEDIAWSVIDVNMVNNQLEVKFPVTYTAPSDQRIKKSLRQRLEGNVEIDTADVSVSVKNGLVTLEGSVPSFWQKARAENEAQQTWGVIAVTNKLASVPTEKITDEVIGERILDRIDQNTVADVDKVDVRVENGEVTLSGTVPNWDTWRSVYDAAQYTSGVTEVIDQLRIRYA